MRYSNLAIYGCGLLALPAYAESSSSTESKSDSRSSTKPKSDSDASLGSQITLSGGFTEQATPTGTYISYSSTHTLDEKTKTSAFTTEAVLSTITSKSSTRTTTLGSTTLYGTAITTEAIVSVVTSGATTETTTLGSSTIYGSETDTKNGTGSGMGTEAASTTKASSQIILSGKPSSSATGAINATMSTSGTATSTSAQPTNTQPCNNYPEFCERLYSNITEVSAHNSPFVKLGNAAANQAYDVTTQLNDGIRLLQGQMHMVNSTPHFCHTSCDVLDAGPITDWLTLVYKWVSTHPYDVVTILLENGDYTTVDVYVPFIQSTGLDRFAYIPPVVPMGISDWPTLANMILTGKRVVFFMDYNANQTAVPWIQDEFSSVWETPYDPVDPSFPCEPQRPPNLDSVDAKQRMYLINHNLNYDISLLGDSLLVPNLPLLNVTNNVTGYGSLGLSAQQCDEQWSVPPRFLNVDFYNVGNGTVFEVAAKYNNVTYTAQCCGIATGNGAMAMLDAFAGRNAAVAAAVVLGFFLV